MLKRAGHEYTLAGDGYIRINGNKWYDHGAQAGGGPVSFVRKQFGLSYLEAVNFLLTGDMEPQSFPDAAAPDDALPARKPFALPSASRTMTRTFAYLSKERKIPTEIISHFVKEKNIYESVEPAKTGSTLYHNIIFVGRDRNGKPRHASKHGTFSNTPSYKGNVAGSDPAYSFHHIGKSKTIFVFEAPIDVMSYIALHPLCWEKHSYVALCGVSEHALLQSLADNPHINEACLCLDNDTRGIEATERLRNILRERDYDTVSIQRPRLKDWNNDLRELSADPHGFATNEQQDLFSLTQSM